MKLIHFKDLSDEELKKQYDELDSLISEGCYGKRDVMLFWKYNEELSKRIEERLKA